MRIYANRRRKFRKGAVNETRGRYAAATLPPRSAKYASTPLKPLLANAGVKLPPRLADLSGDLLTCFGNAASGFVDAASTTGTTAPFASYDVVRLRSCAVTEIDGVDTTVPAA